MNPKIVFLMVALTGFTGISYASETAPAVMASNEKPQDKAAVSFYDQGVDATHHNDFQKALPLFEQALKADPNNPDILNMLAHSQRETGATDEAIENYKKAIELRPNFPEAHEYLGEAYLQAAMHEIDVLKSYGNDGKEELEDLTNDTKEAAGKL